MRGYSPRCTHGRVGRTTKSTLRGTKADTNIFRLNALYQKKTMSDYRCYRLTRWLPLSKRAQMCFHHPALQAGKYPPLKERVVHKKLYYYMNKPLYLHVLHQFEWDCSPAHQPIYSNYLLSCLRTPNSHTFKFKWLYWQWERGKKIKRQQKHRGASVGAGDAIIRIMITLNGTITAWW